MVPHKRHIIAHSLDNGVNEGGVFEDALAFALGLGSVEVALEEYDLEQVEQVHLHRMVLVVDHGVEGSQDLIDDYVSNLIGCFLLLLQRFKNEFHELTCRRVHRL